MSNNLESPNQGGKVPVKDWIAWCDTCGLMCWASQATRLDVYTGKGGSIVCPLCVDSIAWHLVPYVIPAEKPIPWARVNSLYDAPPTQLALEFPPVNYSNIGAFSNTQQAASAGSSWDKQNYVTWDQWFGATWDEIGNVPYVAVAPQS